MHINITAPCNESAVHPVLPGAPGQYFPGSFETNRTEPFYDSWIQLFSTFCQLLNIISGFGCHLNSLTIRAQTLIIQLFPLPATAVVNAK